MELRDLHPLVADKVADAMCDTLLVAWDGCHKIYVALDDEQAQWFEKNYEYSVRGTGDEMLTAIDCWYTNSCGLRFVSAVATNHADPNAGYISLISQGDSWEYDEAQDDEGYLI